MAGDKCLVVVMLMMSSRRQVLITDTRLSASSSTFQYQLSEGPLDERRKRDHSFRATPSINIEMLWTSICSKSENASVVHILTHTHSIQTLHTEMQDKHTHNWSSSSVKIIFLRIATKPGPLFSEDTSGFSSAICSTNTFS